jgi:ribosomal protein S12 methylthiotransferase accessory factor
MVTNPIERSYSLQDAEAALKSELDRLGFDHGFELAGNLVFACKCTITERVSGKLLAVGNGKGEPLAARVGSLFEATEHLFSSYDYIDSNSVNYANTLDFCRNNSLCDKLPLSMLKDAKNATMPFLEYRAVNGPEVCCYPLALSCPSYIDTILENSDLRLHDSFDYRRLEHYSSNSGIAIGMNAEEAIVHGLLENIERTSLSSLLTNTFVLNKVKHLRVIDSTTLPTSIGSVFDRTEKELGGNVSIFEMPNKFGIPAYCSWMEQYEFRVGIAGHGCSLSLENAILRSLYELAQYFLLSKHIFGLHWLKALDTDTLSQLEGLLVHQDCARFDLGSKCEELGYELVNYKDLAGTPFSEHPKEYLSQLTDIIYGNGEVPYASEIKSIGNSIKITHAFVSGEDRFFTVRLGKSAFPACLS